MKVKSHFWGGLLRWCLALPQVGTMYCWYIVRRQHCSAVPRSPSQLGQGRVCSHVSQAEPSAGGRPRGP